MGDGTVLYLIRIRDSASSVSVPCTVATRTEERSARLLTAPWSRLVVSAEVIPAVKRAIAMTDTTIQITATTRPGSVIGTTPPSRARWVMALVDHHTPELSP